MAYEDLAGYIYWDYLQDQKMAYVLLCINVLGIK